MSEQGRVSVKQCAIGPIIILMNEGVDLASGVGIAFRPKDVIIIPGMLCIWKSDDRTLYTTPVIVHCIDILNIVSQRIYIYIDQIITGIILEYVVIHVYAGRAASFDN